MKGKTMDDRATQPAAHKGFFTRLKHKFNAISKYQQEGEIEFKQMPNRAQTQYMMENEDKLSVDQEKQDGKRIAEIGRGRRKGKMKAHKHRKGDQLNMNNEEDEAESKLCKLCNREMPLYFY